MDLSAENTVQMPLLWIGDVRYTGLVFLSLTDMAREVSLFRIGLLGTMDPDVIVSP